MSELPVDEKDAPAKDIAEHVIALWNENANKIEMGEHNGC